MKTRRFAAIVLAGGFSSRMKQFKPLLPLEDTTVTEHVVTTFLNASVHVILVVGHRHEDIKARIKNPDICMVYNPDYEKGMFSSVQAGIRQLQLEHQAFFMLPVDIPLVRPATIQTLMEASRENPGKIIYPTFNGKRGHPPLIPSSLVSVILGWDKKGGLKAVLESYEKLAVEVPVADNFILFDIDTLEDYQELLKCYRG